MEEQLKLYAVTWDCSRDDTHQDYNPYSSGYHQIGDLKVFAYDESEAYDYALIELTRRHKLYLKNMDIIIVFIEEIPQVVGVINTIKPAYTDAKEYGDWRDKLRRR